MKLKLDNLIYTVEKETEIERLKRLGAVELEAPEQMVPPKALDDAIEETEDDKIAIEETEEEKPEEKPKTAPKKKTGAKK